MSAQAFRLPAGGRIDRSRPLHFTFDGRSCTGFAGDTLARLEALQDEETLVVGESDERWARPDQPVRLTLTQPSRTADVAASGSGAANGANERPRQSSSGLNMATSEGAGC